MILQSKKAYLRLFANKKIKKHRVFIEISPKIEVAFNKFVNVTKGWKSGVPVPKITSKLQLSCFSNTFFQYVF